MTSSNSPVVMVCAIILFILSSTVLLSKVIEDKPKVLVLRVIGEDGELATCEMSPHNNKCLIQTDCATVMVQWEESAAEAQKAKQ